MSCVLIPYNPKEPKIDMLNAVKRCVQLMGRKNYENIEVIDSETFSHTSTRGKKKTFKCYGYGYGAYHPHHKEPFKKLYKVNGFYILELPEKE